jgi:hypothetical protein
MNHTPDIIPIRDASIGFGLWPWSKGPLFRLVEPWEFTVDSGGTRERFTIPAGYEFDKASVPPFFWGFPFNYTPDGLCTVPALEHDFLCDLHAGGSDWLRVRLIPLPAAPSTTVTHRHFYDRLLQFNVRPSKGPCHVGRCPQIRTRLLDSTLNLDTKITLTTHP